MRFQSLTEALALLEGRTEGDTVHVDVAGDELALK